MKLYRGLRSVIVLLPVFIVFLIVQHRSRQVIYTNSDPDKFLSTDICCNTISQSKLQNVFSSIQENMTLVSAYFDLGPLRKGQPTPNGKKKYMHWAIAYRFVVNPLIIYTDSDDFLKFMTKVRVHFPQKTKVFKIDRRSLWPFNMINRISAVFSQPRYPKHHPNTVIPAYSATQHAKYAMISDAIRNKYFENEFYAWIDIGYFRNSVNINNYFQLLAPSDLDNKSVAVNQVHGFSKGVKPEAIFRRNKVWVGGGMFIGTADLLLKFEQLYKRAISHFLDKNLMNTDQQLLYSMYSEEGRKDLKPEIELQLYSPGNYRGDHWFYLGYHCRHVLPRDLCPPNTTSTISPPVIKGIN